jgi:flap endonuclease-1
MGDYHVRPVFIFDGKPPDLKMKTLKARREYREKARREWEDAVKRQDYSAAWKKAVRMDSLNKVMQDDAKTLLALLGIPYIQAPEEGEAQAAYLARKGDVWAANSRDYDSVLLGAPRLVRYVTISGQEFLPSKGT